MLDRMLYRFGQLAVGLYARLMINLDVVWHAPLPRGPKIIAANHPTTIDPFLMTILVREQTSILIHETLFKVPVFGAYLRRAGHVRVVEGNGRAACEEARQLLAAGRTVVIFPEGGLSPLEGGLLEPHTGVARLALRTSAPVIPVGIHLRRERIRLVETDVGGKREVSRWYLRGPYAVTVGRPLVFAGDVEDRAYVHWICERLMQRVAQLAQESARRMGTPPALRTRPATVRPNPLNVGVATPHFCLASAQTVFSMARASGFAGYSPGFWPRGHRLVHSKVKVPGG